MSFKKWFILCICLISGILIFTIPPLFATNDTVNDLLLKASKSSWGINETIELQVQDTNTTDTKVVIPLPKETTFIGIKEGNVSATMDEANQQVVLDWKEKNRVMPSSDCKFTKLASTLSMLTPFAIIKPSLQSLYRYIS